MGVSDDKGGEVVKAVLVTSGEVEPAEIRDTPCPVRHDLAAQGGPTTVHAVVDGVTLAPPLDS